MSNVLLRNRTLSDVEYLYKAYKVREEMSLILNNEKIVPKKYKFSYVVPVMQMVRDLEDAAVKYFNAIGQEDEFFTLYRRKHEALLEILDSCKKISHELYQMKRQFMNIRLNRFDSIIELLIAEDNIAKSMLSKLDEEHQIKYRDKQTL